MPTVRDDLRICQSHWRTDAPPLPCPLHIVAGLDDPVAPEQPSLLILEFQAQHNPDKLDVTLEEAANLRSIAPSPAKPVEDGRPSGALCGRGFG